MTKIEEIVKNMREPKLKDIRAVSHISNEEEKTIVLIGNLCGLSEAELDELSLREFNVLKVKLEGFLS